MSSAEDADDERESPAPPVSPWVDPKSLHFTVFVVLPNDDVCTMRDIPSGTSVFDLKGKLEITAGIPSQIYTLVYPDGEEITDDQKLLVQENIVDGYLIKMQLTDSWESLYTAIERNNIEHVYHSGGVHLKGNIVISPDESDRYESVIRERGSVALYMASYFGHQRMVSMLLTVGVNVNGMTHFGRTSLHAAVSKDRLAILGLLLKYGASIRKTDYFGITPLELSRELSSNACTKKLRLMQLNLRGNVDQRQSAKGTPDRSGRTSNNGRSTSEPRLLSRAQTMEGLIDVKDTSTSASGAYRTVSNMSQYSEIHEFSKSQNGQRPFHTSRKNVISSAPDRDHKNKLIFRKCTPSPSQTGNVHVLQPKRIVRWRDIPKENMCWQVIELPHKEEHAIEKAVNIKPVAIIQQKKVLKFAGGITAISHSPEPCPAAPSASPTQETPRPNHEEPKVNEKVVRFTQARLRHFRKLSRNLDTTRTMRRRIRIAVEHEKSTAVREASQAFKDWLEKKARESEESEDDLESVVSANESDDNGKETLKEFNKRVRKRNRLETRSVTPGNRPIPDVVKVGSTKAGDNSNPSAFTNISAHTEWKKQRTTPASTGIERGKSVNDFMVERRRLEEKRQKLLMTAISYDEWMDHVEDRKHLIKQILKADYEEMKKLEEDRLKDRFNRNSFGKWKEKLQQREEDEKRRKEIQRKYDTERTLDRIRAGKASNAAAFKEWLSRKRDAVPVNVNRSRRTEDQKLDDVETESAYEQWINKKHRDEPKHLESQVQKERELLGAMRQLRTESVA